MANIGTTTAFYKVESSLTKANNEVSKSMERLATGKQNANAGDRSSYVAMSDTFRLDFVGTKAGIKGASVAMGYLETGMRVLDAASSLLSRLQELAVLGANDTNTTQDHEAINLEAEALGDEFNRLMTTSAYKGKDVFVEKPMSLTLEDAQKMRETAETEGRILMVGHLLEYHPAVLKLRELIDSGELGEINYIYSNNSSEDLPINIKGFSLGLFLISHNFLEFTIAIFIISANPFFISSMCKIDKMHISIKATTNEKIGFIGKGEGIAAESIVQISDEKNN